MPSNSEENKQGGGSSHHDLDTILTVSENAPQSAEGSSNAEMHSLKAAARSAVSAGLLSENINPATFEPHLDANFYSSLKSLFNELAGHQSQKLQAKLNGGLPVIMSEFGIHSNQMLSTSHQSAINQY
jgi:hypothetical protein